MSKVLEVADAEEVTGNAFSLAITAPDAVHFVKGTCREECRWWSDCLAAFPRSKGRHKRNATFPGGQSSTILPPSQTVRATTPIDARPRLNSCHTEPLRQSKTTTTTTTTTWLPTDADVIPTRDVLATSTEKLEPIKAYSDQPATSASPPTRDKIQTEEKIRTRRVVNREKRGVKSGRSFSEDFSGVLPSWRDQKMEQENSEQNDVSRRILFDDYESESKRDEKLKDIADSLTRVRYIRNSSVHNNRYHRNNSNNVKPTRDGECSEEEQQPKKALGRTSTDNGTAKLVRGDPDGCGLDLSTQRYSPSSELRVDLPAEDLLNIKKGWLMKQGANKEWNKHWFVLRGSTLKYYRDPTSEDKGILDGVVDLNGVGSVTEVQVARNYGFQTESWDKRCCLLSAVTAGIRANWIAALRRVAGLQDQDHDKDVDTRAPSVCSDREPSIVTPRSVLLSSDEEYRTASEGGRRESDDWGESLTPLPPSPPLNRTPISRVKEKARSRSNSRSRVYKRSRSSPPSSRHSTLDSVRPEDLLAACGELPESDAEESIERDSVKSSLFDSAESQATEIEELKRQLSGALCEVSVAEKELLKLRQNKSEIAALEKQVKDLMCTLEQTEHQLELRTREATELEHLKESYRQLLEQHEELLSHWRQQSVGPDWRMLYHQLQDRLSKEGEPWSGCEGRQLQVQLQGRGSQPRRRSFGSLSDLTNVDLDRDMASLDKDRVLEEYDELRGRFEKAVMEIRAMKRELRESHALYDDLELVCVTLRQDAKSREESDRAQASLMVSRVEDLTLKLTAAEKQVRVLKQKLSKSDSRDKRRSLSLKGRESFQICKELEEKLGELEAKIICLETGKAYVSSISKSCRKSRSESPQSPDVDGEGAEKLKSSSARLRRKSLDSATSSEPMKVLIRLSSLESKVAKATEKMSGSVDDVDMSASNLELSSRARQVEVNIERVAEVVGRNMESDIRLNVVEDMVTKSRTKVQQCLTLVSSFKNIPVTKYNQSSLSEHFQSLENSLSEVKDILQQCNTKCHESEMEVDTESEQVQTVRDSVRCIVRQLECVLREKLTSIFQKRNSLKESGMLDTESALKLLAEKLAYETVIVGRILQAVTKSKENLVDFKKWVVDSEILESSRLISNLHTKLRGDYEGGHKGFETSVENLTNVLSKRLLAQGTLALSNAIDTVKSINCKNKVGKSFAHREIISLLLQRQKDLEDTVRRYKEEKLDQLAQALAHETLSQSDFVSVGSLDDKRLREAWTHAQETVNHELIQAEISHVTMKCSQVYESSISAENEAFFSFMGTQRAFLEQWANAVESILRSEMESGIQELTSTYESYVRRWKYNKQVGRKEHHEEDTKESRKLLLEFADVTAHKALVDARISVILRETSTDVPHKLYTRNSVSDKDIAFLLDSEPVLTRLLSESNYTSYINLGAEFEFLFQKFCAECQNLLGDEGRSADVFVGKTVDGEQESVRQVLRELLCLETDLNVLRERVTDEDLLNVSGDNVNDVVDDTRDVDSYDWSTVCKKCLALRQKVASLTTVIMENLECKKCCALQEQLQRLEDDHRQEVLLLKQRQDREMSALHAELEEQHKSLVSQHEREQARLQERARKLERRLGTLDSEYTQQVDNLRAAYQKSLSSGIERNFEGEDNIRQRYQAEIEHLRALCEKGLVAMENSHRRIIAELEEKHRQEQEQLRLEKEQALSEETQATLAALDAMRKAHETEVQKEIAKFKSEFMKKMQSTHDIGALHKEHEAEMEEIKKEILSLSEKYSVKCVESASLEEKLSVTTKQLEEAQQHVEQLDARNKQLRAHLVAEVSELPGIETSELLKEKDLQLEQRSAEVGKLQRQLDTAKAHGEELGALCSRLRREYDGCRGDGAILAAIWNRVQQLAAIWPPHKQDTKVGVSSRSEQRNNKENSRHITKAKQQHTEPSTLSNAELIRSPPQSCSKQSFLWVAPLHSLSPCPLSGMVAERKKLFEH